LNSTLRSSASIHVHPLPLPDEVQNRRGAHLKPDVLPAPQRQIVSWLHALPPSVERNRLLQYLAARPLVGLDLKELRHLWRERSALPQDEWMNRLVEFAENHPHPPQRTTLTPDSMVPENEEDLECIAWMAAL